MSLQKSSSYNLALGFALKEHVSEWGRLRLHNAFNLIILANSYHRYVRLYDTNLEFLLVFFKFIKSGA